MYAPALLLSITTLFSTLTSARPTIHSTTTTPSRSYTIVPGFFLQDDASTDDSTFNPTTTNFGLKNQTATPTNLTQWQFFAEQVERLNRESDPSTTYKVLFLGRHGEGVHNVAQAYYGDVAWALYWSEKNGNGTVTWFDAHLTDKGVDQAQALGRAWAQQIAVAKTPAPQSYYVSPLHRTCATANYTFSGLDLPSDSPFVPTVKENLRELLGVATCDERSNRTFIHGQFPSYTIEPGFTEDDELWSPVVLELPTFLDKRMKSVLDDVFANDNNTFISFTSHSFSIASILRVIGHRKFEMGTGAMIPVLVRAVVAQGASIDL